MMIEKIFLLLLLVLITVLIIICFKLKDDIKKLELKLQLESKTRETQDWKLYNYIKSNYNVLIGKKLPVEKKVI